MSNNNNNICPACNAVGLRVFDTLMGDGTFLSFKVCDSCGFKDVQPKQQQIEKQKRTVGEIRKPEIVQVKPTKNQKQKPKKKYK